MVKSIPPSMYKRLELNNNQQRQLIIRLLVYYFFFFSSILVSAKKPLESLIRKDHSCTPECSSCNRKFDLLESPFHIAQIKNPDKQKACLESMNFVLHV